MKTNFRILKSVLIASCLLAAACNNANHTEAENTVDTIGMKADTAMQNMKEAASEAAGAVKDALDGYSDSEFVAKATVDNMKEIKELQAGADNGTNKELKSHAKMMIADHKKLGDNVKKYAAAKGMKLPENDNGKADEDIADLNKKTKGNDWDKAWVDQMVKAHEDAISLFEKAQNKTNDGELKTMVTDALPTLHSHLDMMKQMQDKLGK